MAAAFIHGIILSFGLILPLGVQNVFVFHQGALQKRFLHALPVVLTASLCDTLFIALAVLGVSWILWTFVWVKIILMAGGMLFLLVMGWKTWRSTTGNQPEREAPEPLNPRKQMMFAASVSLLNPHAIMDTVGVIGTSSLQYEGAAKGAFALASVLVSWIWFAGLALSGRITGRLDHSGRLMGFFNKASAIVMWGSAVYIGFLCMK